MTATSASTSTADSPEAVRRAIDQSWWGQILGLVAYCGMSWAGVLEYPRVGNALGATFIALYLGALLNLIVVAERQQEAESR
jgi:hypothetical protein